MPSLVVGINTYAGITEADSYIGKYYVSTNSKRTSWMALSDDDKEVHLRNALQKIENVKWFGEKYNRDEQDLQWPRRAYYKYPQDFKFSYRYNYHPYQKSVFTYNYIDEEIMPDEIGYAQIEEALELSSITENEEDEVIKRRSLQNQGVTSFRLSKLSESYDLDKGNFPLAIFISHKAYTYLQRFIIRSALV